MSQMEKEGSGEECGWVSDWGFSEIRRLVIKVFFFAIFVMCIKRTIVYQHLLTLFNIAIRYTQCFWFTGRRNNIYIIFYRGMIGKSTIVNRINIFSCGCR